MGRKQVWSVQTKEYEALIKLLTKVREDAGVSMRQLSRDLGQADNYIISIENGSRRVDPVEVVAIAEKLDIEPADLFAEYLKAIGRRAR